jgi:hypothetical protein
MPLSNVKIVSKAVDLSFKEFPSHFLGLSVQDRIFEKLRQILKKKVGQDVLPVRYRYQNDKHRSLGSKFLSLFRILLLPKGR